MPDVVVVGGGPAGCSFAITAARRGRDVVLLDDARRLRSWPGETLPAGGAELVASVFGAGALDETVHSPAYGTAAAWGGDELVAHDYMSHWSGGGWHLDREAFDADLRRAVSGAGVEVVLDRYPSDVTRGATWVVDATGRAGAVVGRLGISRVRVDAQVALVAVVSDAGGERVTTVESVPQGWWYTSPLPGGRRVAALVTDVDLVGTVREETWRSALDATAHIRKLVASREAQVSAYPADTGYRDRLMGEGWVAVGDAAVSFDPLSSQGLLTGIVMAARAAAMLEGDLQAWSADYRAVLAEHENIRREFFASETRWPDAPFWQRRRADSAVDPSFAR